MVESATTGTRAFLFTDIEGSTRRWETDRAAMSVALARHDALLRAAIEGAGGTVFKTVGDAFCAVFPAASAAVSAALAAQRALAVEEWSAFGVAFAELRVRMALHAGEAEARDGDWFGPPLNRVARLLAAGHGGQVLLSEAARALLIGALPEGAALRDLGERRLKDLRAPERVWQLTAPDLPTDFPPLATLDARPNNLPAQPNSLVGREQELAELERLLRAAEGPRLVTLTGPGGTGKTRLALQAAADLIDDFDHGVWLVELAPLADGDLIAATTALALGVAVEGDRTPAEALALWARERRLLLVLDNCEQVIDGVARLADGLLRAAPGIKILATSREPLVVAGEVRLPVGPLDAPSMEDSVGLTPEALAAYDAVRLFVERAAAVRPGFVVTHGNAPAVAQLCHRLDGIPLALELAAARVGSLAVEDIVSRLDQRFRLLGGGSRAVLPRHQTLRACLDWSHDLLSGAERVLFRRLGVFAGRFPLAAAEAVCASEDIDPSDLLDLLTSLCARSLVVADVEGDESCYRLLDTMRVYAREQLEAGGDGPATRDRHLAWCLAMTRESGWFEVGSSPFLAWLRRMARQNDDLLAALGWGLSQEGPVVDLGRARVAIEMTQLLTLYWGETDMGVGQWGWLQLAVEPARRIGDEALLARVLYRAGALDDLARLADPTWKPDQSDEAPPVLEAGFAAQEHLGKAFLRGDERLLRLLMDLGLVREAGWIVQDVASTLFYRAGDLDGAERLFRRSLEIKGQAKPMWHWDLAINYGWLGEIYRASGQLPAALAVLEQALKLYAIDSGLGTHRGWTYLNHALALIGLDQTDAAIHDLHLLVDQARSRHHVQFGLNSLPVFAAVAVCQGDGRRAARLFGATVALWAEAGDDFHGRRRAGLGPADWEDFAAAESAARQLLSPAAWEEAFAQCAALRAEAALAYAMGEMDPWAGEDGEGA